MRSVMCTCHSRWQCYSLGVEGEQHETLERKSHAQIHGSPIKHRVGMCVVCAYARMRVCVFFSLSLSCSSMSNNCHQEKIEAHE